MRLRHLLLGLVALGALATAPASAQTISGNAITTAFSGRSGANGTFVRGKDASDNDAISALGFQEKSDDPCYLQIYYQDAATKLDQPDRKFAKCNKSGSEGNISSFLAATLADGFAATGLRTCLNSSRDKVKGLYLQGSPAACVAGEATAVVPCNTAGCTGNRTVTCGTADAFDESFPAERPNCVGSNSGTADADWEPLVTCAAGRIATGVTLSTRERSGGRIYFDGLALNCRAVSFP